MGRIESPANAPLAVIGMACRLPGADTLDEYWDSIVNGRYAIDTLPSEVLDQEHYYDARPTIVGKTSSKIGGTLRNRTFSPVNCPIPSELADSVDLTHLIMCEVAADACRHARNAPFNLRHKNTGVYVGHDQGSAARGQRAFAACIPQVAQTLRALPSLQHLPQSTRDELVRCFANDLTTSLPPDVLTPRDLSANMIAGTIHQAFGLSGPFQAVDSACASSLQALLLAARALQSGRIDMAIVGGASWGRTDNLVEFSRAGAISATGSRPFDANADGVVCSEGFAAIVLKRLDRAQADADPILAVVSGLGVSSDGKGKGLWAPGSSGQIQAIRNAWAHCGNIDRIQYIEAHATSTPLGDATELNSLTSLLSDACPAGMKIPITSVKANIGHTLEAAGLAGLIKSVLCMQHKTIPPAINVERPTTEIDWDRTPLYLPRTPQDWPAPANGSARRAAVDAFGLGGLNAHVVLDEPQRPRPTTSVPVASSPETEPIAVVGCGGVFPDAANLDQLRDALHQRRTAREASADAWRLDYDWRRHNIPPKQIERADPLQFLILEAVDQAILDCRLGDELSGRSRVGVLVGAEFGGDFASQLQIGLRAPELQASLSRLLDHNSIAAADDVANEFITRLLDRWPVLFDETGSFHNSSLASRIVRTWDLTGGAASLDSGPASPFAALAAAVDMLRAGDCDAMICAAGEHFRGRRRFEHLSTLDPNSPDPTYDDDPFVGAGCFVLKRLTDAKNDGDRIYRVIHAVDVERAATATSPRNRSHPDHINLVFPQTA